MSKPQSVRLPAALAARVSASFGASPGKALNARGPETPGAFRPHLAVCTSGSAIVPPHSYMPRDQRRRRRVETASSPSARTKSGVYRQYPSSTRRICASSTMPGHSAFIVRGLANPPQARRSSDLMNCVLCKEERHESRNGRFLPHCPWTTGLRSRGAGSSAIRTSGRPPA